MGSKNNTKKPLKKVRKKSLLDAVIKAAISGRGKKVDSHSVNHYNAITIIFTVICLLLAFSGLLTNEIFQQKNDITVSELLTQTNRLRKSYHVNELKLNDKLCEAANKKVQDMFKNQYWSHVSPSGVQPWEWLNDVDYNYEEAGENLAKNFVTTSAVMTAWMNSSEHKSNILNKDYEEVGFAVKSGKLNNKSTTLIVALYGDSAVIPGLDSKNNFSLPNQKNSSFITRLMIAFQSVNQIFLISLVVIIVVIIFVNILKSLSYALPEEYHKKWYKNPTLYAVICLLLLIFTVLLLYSNGQI